MPWEEVEDMLFFLLFALVPLIEIALFIQVGGVIGLWPTLGIVVTTAVAGAVLMRRQGRAALDRLQADLRRGADPGAALVQGAAILVAGVLLLTPGFFTDALGLALLFPPSRAILIRLLLRGAVLRHVHVQASDVAGMRVHGQVPDTLEGEYTVLDDAAPGARHARRRS